MSACYIIRKAENTIRLVELSATFPYYRQAIDAQIRDAADLVGDLVVAGPIETTTIREYRTEVNEELADVERWSRERLRGAAKNAIDKAAARRERLRELAANPDPRD